MSTISNADIGLVGLASYFSSVLPLSDLKRNK